MSDFALVNLAFLVMVGLLFAGERAFRRARVSQSVVGVAGDLPANDWRRSLRLLRTRLRETEQELATTTAQNRRLLGEVQRMDAQLREQSLLIRSLRALERPAPERTTSERPAEGGDDARVKRLRALLLKELHPDYAAQDSVDRALREAAFKSLWPKIEEIASS